MEVKKVIDDVNNKILGPSGEEKIKKIPIELKSVLGIKRSGYQFDPKRNRFPTDTDNDQLQQQQTSQWWGNQIPEWEPTNIPPDSTIQVVGKRRTGKSYFTRWLLYHIAHSYSAVYVFTETKMNRWWQQCVSEKHIFGAYEPHIIQKILDRNEKILQHNLEEQIDPKILIILDDVIGEETFKNDPTLKRLFIQGRHFKVGLIVLSQYVFGLSTFARSNTDFVVTALQAQNRQREALARDYADIIDQKEFYSILDNNTQDNRMLVIDLSTKSLTPDNVFYKTKASNPGPFRVGDESCWKGFEDQIEMINNPQIRLKYGWDLPGERGGEKNNDKEQEEEEEEDEEPIQNKKKPKNDKDSNDLIDSIVEEESLR